MLREISSSASNRVGIIGLGLIGGSIAKRLGPKVVVGVFDTNPSTLQSAEASGFKIFDSIRELAEQVDVIFIATPMPEMSDVFDQIDMAINVSQLIVSDVGSVKMTTRQVVLSKRRAWNFVGGHPMAGTESFGFSAASPDLLRGARWVLCIEKETDLTSFMKLAEIITQEIGARVVPLESTVHDSAVANISHLPYVLSSALSQIVESSSNSKLLYQLAAGSFRDGTRVSGTPPTLSRDMCYQNRDSLKLLIREYVRLLEVFSAELDSNVIAGVSLFFEKGNEARNEFLNSNENSAVKIVELDGKDDTGKVKIAELGRMGGVITRVLTTTNQRALEFLVPSQS